MNTEAKIRSVTRLFSLLIFLLMVFQTLVAIISVSKKNGMSPINLLWISMLLELFVLLLPILIYVLRKKLNVSETFRLNKLGLRPAFIILAAAIPVYLLSGALSSLQKYIITLLGGNATGSPAPVPSSIPGFIIAILLMAIVPAFCEEVMFRGLLLTTYQKLGTVRAIVITSIFFGIFHFNITKLIGTTLIGLLLAYYVYKTNSIFAGMLGHFLNNVIGIIMLSISRHWNHKEAIHVYFTSLGIKCIAGSVALIVIFVLLMALDRLTKEHSLIKEPDTGLKLSISTIFTWELVSVIVIYAFSGIIYLAA